MGDRQTLINQMKERQNRWMRERQAEIDRQKVVQELQSTSVNRPAPDPQASTSSSSNRPQTSGGGAPAARPQQQQAGPSQPPLPAQSTAWQLGVRPEEVIDRLTERLTDRLRDELRLELQKEAHGAAEQTAQLENYLVKELEVQNTCSVCYELMVPPVHAPMLLFPCGHTFCNECVVTHTQRNKKTQCPYCRKKIESCALNYSLQSIIQNYVSRRDRQRGQALGLGGSVSEGGAGKASSLADRAVSVSQSFDAGIGEAERLTRITERLSMRLRVLRNELQDTANEEEVLDQRLAAAAAVVGVMEEDEADATRRLEAVKAELALIQRQLEAQRSKVEEVSSQKTAVTQRRELLLATLDPLEQEMEKLELLMAGVSEMHQ